jgi:hypothetical protein
MPSFDEPVFWLAMLVPTTPFPAAILILFIYGLCTSTRIVTFNSATQSTVPDAVRGRIYTLLSVTWQARHPLSFLLGRLIVDT